MSDRFTQWVSLAELPAELLAGSTPDVRPEVAVVQVKIQGSLLDYPSGKSAMVWYGLFADVDVDRLDREVTAGPLVGRWLFVADPQATLVGLLEQFSRRFGSAPSLNP